MKTRLKIMIETDDGKMVFCPGAEELFRHIASTGSVSRAAREMGLSLSKAWKLVKETEEGYGRPLVLRQKGGRDGGMASLSDDAISLMSKYSMLKSNLRDAAMTASKELFS